MKSLLDPDAALAAGLAMIREQFHVPASFSPKVLAAAETAARRVPDQHVDRTDRAFVTLDPATSTDLDQAFAIEDAGGDLILSYAIADVGFFVEDGDALDVEAWARGETLYLPDGRAGLYPPILSEAAASLLPDGPRPAIVFAIRIAADGAPTLDGAERALIRNRAKLAYETVTDADLPEQFGELSHRIAAAETRRGAIRLDPPEQEVRPDAAGRYTLSFRPRTIAEDRNASLSLAANLAIADALLAHHTGLFRVMARPDEHAVARLRRTAVALGVVWPAELSLAELEPELDPADPRQAALMLAIRRGGDGARYAPYRDGEIPWHAPMAASYAQATAPLRRLADRYVCQAALAIASGRAVPAAVMDAFERLPIAMARADARAAQIDHAVIDLAEAAVLAGREGETFAALVTDIDDHGARIQLRDLAVVARVTAHGAQPGDAISVRLNASDPIRREVKFERVA